MDLIQQLLALLCVTDRLEYVALEKRIKSLEALHAATYCHSCGKPNPPMKVVCGKTTDETACCDDEAVSDKKSIIDNIKTVQQDLLDKALNHPRAAFII